MKTLVNKANPQIRITAPEIKIEELPHDYYAFFSKKDWTLVEEEPACKESLQVEEEHPDNFTSFEWLIGRLMFRGCDLWGMTDGEDDNGTVTKLIKDRAAEMMELLERELDPNTEPVGLEKEIKKHTDLFHADIEYPLRLTAIKFYELGKKGGNK